jgi:hypothetical protein
MDQLEYFFYKRGLAVAAWEKGDKEQAKIYATEAKEIRKKMTPAQTSHVPVEKLAELNQALAEIYSIEEGTYVRIERAPEQ